MSSNHIFYKNWLQSYVEYISVNLTTKQLGPVISWNHYVENYCINGGFKRILIPTKKYSNWYVKSLQVFKSILWIIFRYAIGQHMHPCQMSDWKQPHSSFYNQPNQLYLFYYSPGMFIWRPTYSKQPWSTSDITSWLIFCLIFNSLIY